MASAIPARPRIWTAAVVGVVLCLWLVVAGSPAEADATADLTVTVTSDATGLVARGEQLRYTVSVANAGTATAHEVSVTVRLPPGVTPIHLLPTMEGGVCSATGSTEPGSTYTAFCTRRTLVASGTATVTVDGRVDRNRRCGSMRAVAIVGASDEPSAARDDDTATRVDGVRCEASIDVEGPGPAFARAGAVVGPRFVVTNDGELTLQGLDLDDAGCSITPAARILRPGGHRVIGCTHRIVGATDGMFRVRVVARSPDGDVVRAAASARYSLIHPALAVSLPTPRVAGAAGTTVSYRVVVRNTGDSRLSDLTVRRSAWVIGHVASLPAGGAATLTTSEALHVAGSHPDVITATGRDRSGTPISAQALAVVTVSAKRSPAPPATAFTGGRTATGGAGAGILALLGAAALVLGRRRSREAVSN